MMNLALILLPFTLVATAPLDRSAQDDTRPVPPPFEAPPDVIPEVEGGVFTRFYHPSGALAREGYLVDGARAGVWKGWDESGARRFHGEFKDYRRVGPWVSYGAGVRTVTQGSYDDVGRRHGTWATYGAQRDLRMLARFDHGVRVGAFERFTRGGKLVERTTYKDGLRDGLSIKKSTGAKGLVEQGNWSAGKRLGPWQFYHPDGALKRAGEYLDGREQGEWIGYFPNGKRESVGQFEAGRAVGQWTGFYKQGERRFVTEFAEGLQQGPHSEWWRSGQLKAQGEYQAGLFEGPWKFWSAEGQLDTTRTGRYSKGSLIQ